MYRTERLVMREWTSSDIDPFFQMCSDSEVMRYFPTVMTYDECALFIDRVSQRHKEDGFGLWAVEAEGSFAGFTGLARATFSTAFTPCVEVGWRLASWAWGKGYATEAMTAILDWADAQALGEIRCIIDTGNTASHNVAGKLGFTKFAESHDVIGDLFIYRRTPHISQ